MSDIFSMAFAWQSSKICVALLIFIIPGEHSQQLDPCVDAHKIGNEKRSMAYTLGQDEDALCDMYLDKNLWYSFEERTGSQIPELATLDYGYCGTTIPLFIKKREGTTYHHEAKTSREDTTAIVISAIGSTAGTVIIRWCEQQTAARGRDVFVYLLSVPAGCDLSYCAGDQPACAQGLYWNGLLQQCVGDLPQMTSNPTLRGPLIVKTAVVAGISGPVTVRQFAFFCDVGYKKVTKDNGARFRIQLSFNNVLNTGLIVDDANSTHPSTMIPETLLRGQMGKTLRCHVRAFWVGNVMPRLSEARQSNPFWMGIKSTMNPVVIQDRPDVQRRALITYTSTVPITCWHCAEHTDIRVCRSPCQYSFTVGGKGITKNKCKLEMVEQTNANVINSTFLLEVEITQIFPTTVSYYSVYFDKNTDSVAFGNSVLWKDYIIPNVTVEFRQQAGKQQRCWSNTDPHIVTLSGLYIDNYMEGVFNLLSSKRGVPNMNLQIQVQQVRCNGQAACNCAVIIREWNNIQMFDACGSEITWARVPRLTMTTLLQPSDTSKSNVFRDSSGTVTTAIFPSGLEVTIRTDSWFSIEIKLPGFYNGSVDGLCTDVSDHGTKYRLENADPKNLFTHEPNCSYVSIGDFECVCKGETNSSNSDYKCEGNKPYGTRFHVATRTTGHTCGPSTNRRRRSTWAPRLLRSAQKSDDYVDPSEVYKDVSYDPNFGSNVKLVWPTLSGITKAAAEKYCRSTIQSSATYARCAKKFDETGSVRNCAADVQISDKLSGAEAFRTLMESSCLYEVFAESNVTSAEDAEVIPAVVAVTQNICPNGCSGHGTCSKATCTCAKGYVGPDCSIDVNSPPVIISLYQNGMCRTNERPCAHTNVVASNIYDSPDLTCRYKRFHLTDSSIQMAEVDEKGKLNTAGEMQCPSPDDVSPDDGRRLSVGYYLSVSNDGIMFSNERTLIISDPACLNCADNTTACQQKNNTCFIGSLCYVNGERKNVSANCLTCVPKTAGSLWTDTVTWSDWSHCSRTCDIGATQRRQLCASKPSPSLHVETVFCRKMKCRGKPNERMQGVVISTSASDLKVILTAEQKFFAEIANAVNTYCGLHAAECCAALGLTTSGSTGATMNVTTTHQCHYAASYPDTWSTPARNKVIVKAYTNVAPVQCSGKSRLATEIYFNKFIVLKAVTQAKHTIGTAVDVTISRVALSR